MITFFLKENDVNLSDLSFNTYSSIVGCNIHHKRSVLVDHQLVIHAGSGADQQTRHIEDHQDYRLEVRLQTTGEV